MSNQQGARQVVRGPHGGQVSVHRFGTDGDWADGPDDAVLFLELPPPALVDDLCCRDCDSIATVLPFVAVGVTHSPGCPWLTGAARSWKRP